MSATFPGQDRAKHMGELKRGDERWDVFVEMQPDAEVGAVRGRVHFVNGEHRRTTSWIFLERSEREIQERFGEFSAGGDRKSTRLNSSHSQISYAVFCLKKKKTETRVEPNAVLLRHLIGASHRRRP